MSGVYIRVYGVVHDVIKVATKDCSKDESYKVVHGAVTSFSKLENLDSIVMGTRTAPLLKMLSLKIKHMVIGKGYQNSPQGP